MQSDMPIDSRLTSLSVKGISYQINIRLKLDHLENENRITTGAKFWRQG